MTGVRVVADNTTTELTAQREVGGRNGEQGLTFLCRLAPPLPSPLPPFPRPDL